MKSKVLGFLILSFSIISIDSFSQVSNLSKNSGFAQRIYFGGGLDLQLNSFYGLIGASPSIGYMLTSSTSIGTGITYQYISFRGTAITSDIYGYRFFIRQNLFKNIFAYAEYENLSYRINPLIENSGRIWDNAYYIGGGLYQPISDKAGFLMLGLYDLTKRNYEGSPFSFRAGITFSPF